MISKVILRRFKRFDEQVFDIPGHVVLAGPNNTGKTTLLQAVAAWSTAFNRWKQLSGFKTDDTGSYIKVPIGRLTFSAVPLRAFDLLWSKRDYQGSVEIELHSTRGWKITMELIADSIEQIYVRPIVSGKSTLKTLREAELPIAYVPPMTGLSTDEPVLTRPKLDQLLGQGKPGDIIRNLLVEAHRSEEAWAALNDSIKRLFGHEVLPPDATGPDIIAEYKTDRSASPLDIASAGSGFQQVLMLLTFLYTRPASVLLLDEPDAHLHVILQDVIYGELRSVAVEQNSQLIIATHSEVIINAVEPRELCMLLDRPRILENTIEREHLAKSLGILTHMDIMQALEAPGILYLEDYTDLNILRELAKILGHPTHEILTTRPFWKKMVWETRLGASGIKCKEHFDALKLVREDMRGLELVDGDARMEIQPTPITGVGLQRQRWRRYEVESYLLHPGSLARYVEKVVGNPEQARIHVADLRKYFETNYPPAFILDPLGDYPFLNGTKARTELIPPALAAAGLPNIHYRDYYEIASVMLPEEIHPEVKEKLDAIKQAFGL